MTALNRPHQLHLLDIEAAINYWRQQKPSTNGFCLCDEIRYLVPIYTHLALTHQTYIDVSDVPQAAYEAWLAWYQTTPDTPCIAICSTSQGDDVCKGCHRTLQEVQHWPNMSPAQKRQTWLRLMDVLE